MSLAIFGITNGGLNLVATLFLLLLVVLWLALIVYTYLDARRRISDPFLVACATVASFFPFVGTAVYAIVRPPEYLDDVRERELEIKAMERRLGGRDLHCPVCRAEVDSSYLVCPVCTTRLRQACVSCGAPLEALWQVCPYCETQIESDGQTVPIEQPRRRRRRERPA
jgi:RNA polymerase subunit RPABC4/transcription elongation factor Spt4